jgi:hypothetical protein
VLVVIPPEDVKDGILEADGLQRALVPVTAAAAGASSTVAAVTAPSTALDAGGGGSEMRPMACPEGCPVEPLRDGDALAGVEGLGGSPSVRELEERFGGSWRYISALRQRFYVRRKLVRWVEARTAAAMDRLGPSPDRFYRELGKGQDPLANVALE